MEKGPGSKSRTQAEKDADVPLIKVAEGLLEGLRERHAKEAEGASEPKGAMLGAKWVSVQLEYDDRSLRVAVPMIILASASRDFQLGYIYSALVRKIKPRMKECPDCGKLHEPLYLYSDNTLYKAGAS